MRYELYYFHFDIYFSILKNSSVAVVFGQTYELLLHSEAAIVNSGTATLETALIGTPQVVVYHVAFGKLAYWLKKLLLHLKITLFQFFVLAKL